MVALELPNVETKKVARVLQEAIWSMIQNRSCFLVMNQTPAVQLSFWNSGWL